MKKMAVGILNISNGKFKKELIDSLKDNIDWIDEIIFTADKESLNFEDMPVKYLNLQTDNKAVMRNNIIEACESEYILWLSDSSELDPDFLEEAFDTIEEYPQVDILYPNEVVIDLDGGEILKKYDEYFSSEINLLRSLQIERAIPEFGVITKRDIFLKLGNFDENYYDYEFYDFLWENVKQLKLKHIKFAFLVNRYTDSFIDTSYASKSLRENLENYEFEELFPLLGWNKNNDLALATAYQIIGDILSSYYDLYNASDFYRKSAISFHNKISIGKIVETYYNMGLFEEATKLLNTDQGFNQEEIDQFTEKIDRAKQLIENTEKAIMEGNVREVFEIIGDIYDVYKGAPIVNIIGVIEYIGGNLENAYKFFYKAAMLNPLADDILHNLTDTAKQLGREEKVKALINRLFR